MTLSQKSLVVLTLGGLRVIHLQSRQIQGISYVACAGRRCRLLRWMSSCLPLGLHQHAVLTRRRILVPAVQLQRVQGAMQGTPPLCQHSGARHACAHQDPSSKCQLLHVDCILPDLQPSLLCAVLYVGHINLPLLAADFWPPCPAAPRPGTSLQQSRAEQSLVTLHSFHPTNVCVL